MTANKAQTRNNIHNKTQAIGTTRKTKRQQTNNNEIMKAIESQTNGAQHQKTRTTKQT